VHFARRRWGLTQTELARRIGVGNVTISRIETGHVERVQLETLVALARELRVSTDYLLGLTNEIPEKEDTPAEVGASALWEQATSTLSAALAAC
jgi:transcriptional regulator with XRE-family HTH domain